MRSEKSSISPEDKIAKNLRIIIRLLIQQQISAGKMTMKDVLVLLDSMDVGSTEIGQIIGWSQGAVGSELSKLKRGRKK